ncbi:hypothetical protein [Sphingobium sp. Cam5-1]|uniref:hypothetical protein n=1 Tax=Sphingobium sp. Cam5-1 TaxID=2789327 RepID=UPI0018AD222D|nr:hypothetical protein [Sphingobium sp. Cam5-1]QPI75444.1 hypothetical protein IZV00_20085 [Sphingobium sp. Cam5-1]
MVCQSLRRDAVALDEAHVRAGDLAGLTGKPDETRFYDRAAPAKTGQPVAAR